MRMTTSLFIAGYIAFLFVLFELVHVNVFGWYLKEPELDAYFAENMKYYELNEMDSSRKILFGMKTKDVDGINVPTEFLPYVAIGNSPLSKWHVGGFSKTQLRKGTIPRWSKWSKALDLKRENLIAIEKELKAYEKISQ